MVREFRPAQQHKKHRFGANHYTTIDLLTPEGVQRVRNMEDGDEININAAIDPMMSTAINGIGAPFALHCIASDGRHDIQYYRFKDFNQHFDDGVRSRLSGMQGGLSTRMGAAMRHDTRKAVEELYSKGIVSYCLTLDPNDDNYVKRIFSKNNYTIVDNVQKLLEKLPALFATLTS